MLQGVPKIIWKYIKLNAPGSSKNMKFGSWLGGLQTDILDRIKLVGCLLDYIESFNRGLVCKKKLLTSQNSCAIRGNFKSWKTPSVFRTWNMKRYLWLLNHMLPC